MTNFNSEPVLQNSGLLNKYLSITFYYFGWHHFYLSSGKNINKILSWRNFWYVVDLRQNDPIEHSYLILHNIITILYRPGHLISPEWSWCVGFSTVHHHAAAGGGCCCYEVVRFAASKARFHCSPILGGDYCPQRRHLCYPGFQPCMGGACRDRSVGYCWAAHREWAEGVRKRAMCGWWEEDVELGVHRQWGVGYRTLDTLGRIWLIAFSLICWGEQDHQYQNSVS